MENSPVYELRMYETHPKDFLAAVGMFNQNHAMRTKHSELFGFWMTYMGDEITKFVHIWKYDSLSHRNQVLAAMGKDPECFGEILPFFRTWNNALLRQCPHSSQNLDFCSPDPSAMYLLQEIKTDRHKRQQNVPDNEEGGGVLVARFGTILGMSNTEYRFWRFPDIDAAVEAASKMAMESSDDGRTTLLTPAPFSPLQ